MNLHFETNNEFKLVKHIIKLSQINILSNIEINLNEIRNFNLPFNFKQLNNKSKNLKNCKQYNSKKVWTCYAKTNLRKVIKYFRYVNRVF